MMAIALIAYFFFALTKVRLRLLYPVRGNANAVPLRVKLDKALLMQSLQHGAAERARIRVPNRLEQIRDRYPAGAVM